MSISCPRLLYACQSNRWMRWRLMSGRDEPFDPLTGVRVQDATIESLVVTVMYIMVVEL